MRSLVLDELRADEIAKAEEFLNKNLEPSNISGLYWMMLPYELLTDNQKSLEDEMGPYKLSVDLGADSVRFELLVRGSELTNVGGGAASEAQVRHVHAFAERMAKELNFITCL
jgi:hypothetical protein